MPISNAIAKAQSELEQFDWFNHKNTVPPPTLKPPSIMLIKTTETVEERKLRMLFQLSSTCIACSMCELGLAPVGKTGVDDKLLLDPHLLSNLKPSRFMVIGQNPGWNELRQRVPFIGQAGQNFDAELARNDLNRDMFYICNAVRCYTRDNAKPTDKQIKRCQPFLQIEINLLKPKLLITLGNVAFKALCPDLKYAESLGELVKSSVYNAFVFPIYHPSPLNLADKARKSQFELQMATMAEIVKGLNHQ